MARKPRRSASASSAKNSSQSDNNVREETGADRKPIERWIEEIQLAKEANKDYWETVDKIVKKYKDDEAEIQGRPAANRKYNVLWSVVQTMQPLVYSEPPKAHVARKHNDRDPAGRDASLVLERSLTYELEGFELHDSLLEARDDYIFSSRGVIWPKYKPYMKLRQSEEKTYVDDEGDAPEGAELKYDDEGTYYHKEYEEKVHEEVDWEHVHYRDFLHGRAAKWRHVPWVARRVPMTRKELIKRFGDVGKQPPLTIDCRKETKFSDAGETDADRGMFAKAEVWEVWCKDSRKVYWVCPNWKKAFLDEQDDFLELDQFFPCPKPAFGTKTNDSLIPTPDYKIWQDIAIELDEVTTRIKLLTESLRVVGIYDKSMGNVIERITKQTGENDLIGVEGWAMMQDKGGLKGAIEWFPVEQVAAVLDKMHVARQRLVAELYEITGISDIVRGASDPRETAKAQQIKGNFANKRISTRQNEMIRMADEALEIQAQIICKHYSPDTLRMISSADQVLTDPRDPSGRTPSEARFLSAVMLLKNSPLRRFRIKVDEKSLAMPDINGDREERVQFVQGVSQLLTAATSMIQVAPAAGPLLGEILLFAVRGFPLAKSTEASIEGALEQLLGTPLPQQGEEGKSAGPAPKSPQELAIDEQKVQIERMRAEAEIRFKERELALRERELALKEKEMLLQAQNRDREALARETKNAADAQLRAQEVDNKRQEGERSAQLEAYNSQLDRQERVESRAADQYQKQQQSERDYSLSLMQQESNERNAFADRDIQREGMASRVNGRQ